MMDIVERLKAWADTGDMGRSPDPSDMRREAATTIASLRAEVVRLRAGLEPVAVRYDFDGYGYRYIDSGSGSDWLTRHSDGEPLYPQALADGETKQARKQKGGEA